jgi:hypothetical protein
MHLSRGFGNASHLLNASFALIVSGIAASQANAAFVYKLVNKAVPNTADGLFYNLVTGAQSTSESTVNTDAPGWDFNPYGSSTNLAFNQSGGSAYFVNNGTYADPFVSKLAQGFLISSALPTKVSGSTPGFNSLMGGDVFVNNGLTGAWLLNANNIIGFKFTGELNQTLYGWARFSLGANSGVRTFVDYAYDNAGGSVLAGVIVPVPGALALFGLAGFATKRRRNLAASLIA